MIADQFPWLTAIVLLPLVASVAIPFLPDTNGKTIRWYALGVGIADFVLMCWVFWTHYDPSISTFQIAESTGIDRTYAPVVRNRVFLQKYCI